jgi:hypothetical protein
MILAPNQAGDSSRTNLAISAVVLEWAVSLDGNPSSLINDGKVGNAWSAASGGVSAFEDVIYVGLAFQNAAVLVDTILFGRDNSGADRNTGFAGTYTIQATRCILPSDYTGSLPEALTAAIKSETSGCSWETIGSLIYTEQTPANPSVHHTYRVSPAVSATAIRLVLNSQTIKIDEIEVYGVSRATTTWARVDADRIVMGDIDSMVDSSGFPSELIVQDTDPPPPFRTKTGSSISVSFGDNLYVIYGISLRAPVDTVNQIIGFKMAYINIIGQLMYISGTELQYSSADPADAVDVLTATPNIGGDIKTSQGQLITLGAPIETSQLRYFDIEGATAGNDIVDVQFGLWGREAKVSQIGSPGDPHLAMEIQAHGFDSKVGCDTVDYTVTVQHIMKAGGQNLARHLRVSDMLSDPKIQLVPNSVHVYKSTVSGGSSAEWAPVVSPLAIVLYGNNTSDAFVVVDVDHLYIDEVLRVTYTVRAIDPVPKDIISTRAIVELVTSEAACDLEALTSECRGDTSCGTGRRAIAQHDLVSDVGTLIFSHSVKDRDSTKPFQVTVDGVQQEVYLVTLALDVSLLAGAATNIMLSVSVPSDRTRYFEFLSIDNLDNNARTGPSEDDTILTMDLVRVMTEEIRVPCTVGADTSTFNGMQLELTGALYNSFYYSDDYACGDYGCNELNLEATLEYDLLSSIIFHARYANELLLNATRADGFDLPNAVQTAYGVRYIGGNPTWPVFTINLMNGELPPAGYEASIVVLGDFSGLSGRLSVKISSGADEYFMMRNPIQKNSTSCGSVGKITTTDKDVSDCAAWNTERGIAATSMELKLKVLQNGLFITGNLDGHVITKLITDAQVNLGKRLFISLYKELEADSVIIGSIDASFVCYNCTVRQREVHKMEIRRPGIPPSDILLQSKIVSGDCAALDACVAERVVEGTRVGKLVVVDGDRIDGDIYMYEIVGQDVEGLFRLSASKSNVQDEVWVEIGADRVLPHSTRSSYGVSVRVVDNVWADHAFVKTFRIQVVANPDSIVLSKLEVTEGVGVDSDAIATISSNDPDTSSENIKYSVATSGDGALFKINGTSLLVGATIPPLLDKAFFDITIIATDWNGLFYSQDFKLFSVDTNECESQSPACVTVSGGQIANVDCINKIGGFMCACHTGYSPSYDESDGSVQSCDDTNECGPSDLPTEVCGPEEFINCTNTVGGYNCEAGDIDECEIDNGGCGDKRNVLCSNEYAAPPTCSDICDECANGCANGFCADYDMAPSTCFEVLDVGKVARPSYELVAGTEIQMQLSGNVDPEIEVYAILQRRLSSGYDSSEWEDVSIVSSSCGAAGVTGGDCMIVSLTPTSAGLHYIVINNYGQSLAGTPFIFDVVEDHFGINNADNPNVALETADIMIDIADDGLEGGKNSASSEYTLTVTAKDVFGNVRVNPDKFDVIASMIEGNIDIYVSDEEGNQVGLKAGYPSVEKKENSGGDYELTFNFDKKTDPKTYGIKITWPKNGDIIRQTDSFRTAKTSDLSVETACSPDMSTVRADSEVIVAGTFAGFVIQCRNEDGLALSDGPAREAFRVVVSGPTSDTLPVRLSQELGRYKNQDDWELSTIGHYLITVIFDNRDADDNVLSSDPVGQISIKVIAADTVPALSSAIGIGGPFPTPPTVRPVLAGVASTIRIIPRDDYKNENRHADLESRIVLTLRPDPQVDRLAPIQFGNCTDYCDRSCIPGMIKRGQDGSYLASYITTTAGSYALSVQIDGVEIDGFPIPIVVAAARASTFSSTALRSHLSAVAGQTAAFPLVLSDQFGNSGAFPDGSAYVELAHGTSPTKLTPQLELRDDRKVWIEFTCEKSGDYDVRVKVNGDYLPPFTDNAAVRLAVSPGPVANIEVNVNDESVHAGDTITILAGVTTAVDITCDDQFGNRAFGGSNVYAVLANAARTSVVNAFASFNVGAQNYHVDVDVPAALGSITDGFYFQVFVDGKLKLSSRAIITAPTVCTVGKIPFTVAAGPLSFSVQIVSARDDMAMIAAQFSAGGTDPIEVTADLTCGGATCDATVQVDLNVAGVYTGNIVVAGDERLCLIPAPVAVTPASPQVALTSLEFPQSEVMIGTPFEGRVTAADEFGNTVRIAVSSRMIHTANILRCCVSQSGWFRCICWCRNSF